MRQTTVRLIAESRPLSRQAAWLLPALLPALLAPGLAGCEKPAGGSRISAAPPIACARSGAPAARFAVLTRGTDIPQRGAHAVRQQGMPTAAVDSARPAAALAPALAMRERSAAPRGKRTARSAGSVPLACRIVPGERRSYALEYASIGASDFQALFASRKDASRSGRVTPSSLSHVFRTAVRGRLVATVVEQKADRVLLTYSLQQPELGFEADGQEAAEADTIRRDLGREIFATVTRRGSLLSVRFDPAVGKLSQSFARTLLALTQVVLPPREAAGRDFWLTREQDPSGVAVARYEWVPGTQRAPSGAAIRTFHKSIVRYLPPHREIRPGEFEVATEIRTSGGWSGAVDAGTGELTSLSGTREQVVLMNGRQVGKTRTTLRLRLLTRETASAAERARLQAVSTARGLAAAMPLFVPASKQGTEAAIQRGELGEDTLESLTAALTRIDADPRASDTTLYLKFKALAYLHPEACERLGDLLAAASSRSRALPLLTGALGSAGHAAAQAALVRAIQTHHGDWAALCMLIPTLGGVPVPTPAAEAVLRDLVRHSRRPEIATTAELSLGIMGRHLAWLAPARSARIVAETLAGLRSARSPEAIRQRLLVLGNTGSPRALPAAARCIKSRSPVIRAAATDALRGIDAAPAGRLLTHALAVDPDAGVRQEAAIALGARTMDPAALTVQTHALLEDRAAAVRLAVLSNLWRARQTFPEVAQLIRQAAARDADKDVRKTATELTRQAASSAAR